MNIHALGIVDEKDDDCVWVVLSPPGKIKAMDPNEFLRQVARPHTLEYELRIITDEDVEDPKMHDAFKHLQYISHEIRDVSSADLVDFYKVWGAANNY